MKILVIGASLVAMGLATAAPAMNAAELDGVLQSRFKGDRTKACVVAAVIEPGKVVRGRTCAKPRADGGPGYQSTFEIGSVTKTMTAFLVADLIGQGKWSLDDPVAKHLPPGTKVPVQKDRQILVRDLLTHTSGLSAPPPGFAPTNMSDPYGNLTEAGLLAALAKVELNRPIGSQFEYSNFGMMLVSLAVARSYGSDYESILTERLFIPLKMDTAYINKRRGKSKLATGHLPSGAETSAWHVTTNLAGVGMVRASLDDLIKYAQAQLGQGDESLVAKIRLTQQPLSGGCAMNWMRFKHKEHELAAHEGSTGGFSSLVVVDLTAQRAAVILADTSLVDLGGLGEMGNVLLGLGENRLRPRLTATPSAEVLAAITGEYELNGLSTRIWLDGQKLMVQAEGQSAFDLYYDNRGDFYPKDFSALLTPEIRQGKVERATWRQSGGVVEMVRKGNRAAPTASNPLWKDFAGEYALMPQFKLRVFEEDGRLKVQGTGQPSVVAEVTGPDRIEIKSVGAVIEFKRDAQNTVTSAVLKQQGVVLEGKRQWMPLP